MFKFFWLAVTMVAGTLAALSQATEATAAAAMPLHVLQLEKYFTEDPLVQNVHGWHCRRRAGPYGWHRHRRACRRAYEDPYEEPYYDDERYYDDGRYYDGGPSIVIRPNRRARRGCSRKVRRNCIRRWRHNGKRRARCLRKYRC